MKLFQNFSFIIIAISALQGCSPRFTTKASGPISLYPDLNFSQTVLTEAVGDLFVLTPQTLNTQTPIVSCSTSPPLPAWASINPTTCVISGTPTSTLSSTIYTITATNTLGNTSSVDVDLMVAPGAPTISFASTTGRSGRYTASMAVAPSTLSNNGAAITNCTVSPALPAWASLNATTCQITGMPTSTLTPTSYTVTATNSAGSRSASVTLDVTSTRTTPGVDAFTIPAVGLNNDIPTYFATVGTDVYYTSMVANGRKVFRYNGTTATQAFDVNPPGDDNPVLSSTTWGGNIYVAAYNGSTGKKLYQFDGTTLTQISNTNPGGDDNPYVQGVFLGRLFFNAKNASGLFKLYMFDGSGVTQITNTAASGNDGVGAIIEYNGKIYFSASNGTGTKLYEYDGTTVTQVSNLKPAGSDNVSNLTLFNSKLYFYAYNTVGKKIYSYDGATFTQITNFNAVGDDSLWISMNVTGTKLYFAGDQLYEHNGTTTVAVPGLQSISNLYSTGTDLYVYAYTAASKWGFYKYNGTTVSLIKNALTNGDSFNAAYSSYYVYIIGQGSNIYFPSGVSGNLKMWMYDGNTTTQVSDLNPGGNDVIAQVFSYGGQVYFKPENIGNLYTVSGATVSKVSNVNPSGYDQGWILGYANSKVYYRATNSNGETKLYEYNGTTSTVINSGNPGMSIKAQSIVWNGKMYLIATRGSSTESKLYSYDGTTLTLMNGVTNPSLLAAGTNLNIATSDGHLYRYDGTTLTQAPDINGTGLSIGYIYAINTDVYFQGISTIGAVYHDHLYRYDGTTVTQLTNTYTADPTCACDNISYPSPVIANQKLYFSAYDGNYTNIYEANGNVVTQISGLTPGVGSNGYGIYEANSKVYFDGDDGLGGHKLFEYASSSLNIITDLIPGGDDGVSGVTAYGTHIVFNGTDDGATSSLFEYDGTTTTKLRGDTAGFVVNGNMIYLSDYGTTYKLYLYNGSTFTQISDTNPGGQDNPYPFMVIDDVLYFISTNTKGTKLFSFDGYSVVQESNASVDTSDQSFGMFQAFQGKLYFTANAGNFQSNQQMFRTR